MKMTAGVLVPVGTTRSEISQVADPRRGGKVLKDRRWVGPHQYDTRITKDRRRAGRRRRDVNGSTNRPENDRRAGRRRGGTKF